MARNIMQVGGLIYLETKSGSGDYKVPGQFSVFNWVGTYETNLSDAVRTFKTYKAAQNFCAKNPQACRFIKTTTLCNLA